ncbi:Hermansky-Pudlak syndrome 3 protein isoform X3 [Gadus macrocephalus]|uniref:Hermansky-Pudlak syndrome 3 protein isoform X3 n=1 Tax=Gadus macrocephalus TaxID=80720 RepID=UPI0028CBB21D|nr:Hermansky-Pudlak syndrome 3 protein isoform X3 [Gadus macrocephalus]
MVHVYNCHPFASQQIVQVEQEPGLLCSGGGVIFVVATGGCKVEAYSLDQEGCPLLCRFATMGTPRIIQYSAIGDYLVTIEDKNNATYLRAYTNWRYQAEEKSRVGVRMLGHLLRGASQRSVAQMEIIEIPLSERPVAVACCPVTGDLLVACEKTLVLFTLRRESKHNLNQLNPQSSFQNTQPSHSKKAVPNSPSNPNVSVLDFERSVILHIPGLGPQQVALCAGYIAVHAELEVLVVKLHSSLDPKTAEELADMNTCVDQGEDPGDFLVLQRHQELLGERARDCGVSVTIEKTGMEETGQYTLSFVLYRRFAPDFFQGCSVEETKLHSLQLHPMFTRNKSMQSPEEPSCVFCFFSLPTTGYLYSLRGGVELLSAYQYPEKVLRAVLTDDLLHVITKSALQCFSVRCAAVAARVEDPYIDTTMRACPPVSLKVCALRMQLFIGLRTMCALGRHVMLLSAADAEPPEEADRATHTRSFMEHSMLTDIFLALGIDPTTTPALESLLSRPFLSKKWAGSRPKAPSVTGHGWNLYVVNTVSPITLYHEMVEYSCRYAETHPMGESCRHLLSEAHLILRASLIKPLPTAKGEPRELPEMPTDGEKAQRPTTDAFTDSKAERQVMETAFRENCAQLGDCFSRGNQKDCHLALPYYRMSGLSITEVMSRNRPLPISPCTYGPGFVFYLNHFLLEETDQILSQEAADEIIDIFSQTEPSQLVTVCASPAMADVSPAKVLRRLQHLEQATGISVPLTVTMATMSLRLDDLRRYTELMEKHAEMLLVYGFIEEPRLLLHGGSGGRDTQVRPTQLANQLRKDQPGLLTAAMVALHENNKVQLEQADQVFKELGCEHSLLVDFWEAVLVASTQEAIIQELLFRLAVVYIDRLTSGMAAPSKLLKSTEDLINSCSHYGTLYPWLRILTPASNTGSQQQEALQKLQSLLCGPSMPIGAVQPLLEQLSLGATLWGLSLHVLCATRRGQHGNCIEKLLDHCPQAIIPYANHHLQETYMALWWQKLLPELCNRTRAETENGILLAALKETLLVVANEISPVEFLELMPDDGTALYFLPHLLACSQRQLLA